MRVCGNAVALLAVISGLSLVLGEEPGVGVWKFNAARSMPIPNPPQSLTFTVKAEDDMMVMTEDVVTAEGAGYQVTLRMAFDGKDYPVTGSRAGIELVSGRKVNANCVEIKAKKKDGAVVATYWGIISADGKSRIRLTWWGAEMSGPPNRVAVDDKQ
jgi:hypothetical protein